MISREFAIKGSGVFLVYLLGLGCHWLESFEFFLRTTRLLMRNNTNLAFQDYLVN